MNEKQLYQRALDLWGRFAQEDMLFEEIREVELALILLLLQRMCRLEIAILKLRRSKTVKGAINLIEAIAEEVADTKIMLGQMELLYNIEEPVKRFKKQKLARLEKRIIKAEKEA